MRLADFYIGLEFVCGPFWWRCTDVGTRTIAAIRLAEDDPVWYQGPPYMVDEVVFDEVALVGAHRTELEAVEASVHEADTSGHPGIPREVVSRMLRAKGESARYPRSRVLKFNRVRGDGEVLHPFAAHRQGSLWFIQVYLPFTGEWTQLGEREFCALSLSTPDAIRQRAGRWPCGT